MFWVNVPVGIFGTVWAYRKLRDTGERHGRHIDWWGNVTFAVGLSAILIAITDGIQPYRNHTMGWTNPLVEGLLLGGVLLLAAFVVIETKVAEPMIELSLFRIRAFTAGNVAGFVVSIARGGLQFMLVIWLPLHGYDYSQTPLWAGIFLLPLTAGFLIAGPVAGTLSDRFGSRGMATAGMVVFGGSFIGLILLPVNFSYWDFALLILANGIGGGMFAAPNSSSVMSSVPASQRGVASGMRATFQNTGTALSIGVFFALMIAGLASTLPKSLTSGLHQQGVPQSIAPHAGSLPPVSSLFAAMLGVNPVQHLLAASRVLATLPAAAQRILTGREFFPDLISGPFHHGLVIVFAFAVALSVVAAVASMLRGGRPTDAGGTDELLPTPDPMPTTAVLGDSTAVVTEDRGRGDDSAFSCLASISTTSGTSQQPDGRKEEHMALTTLDDKVALVVIDLQTGVVAAPTVHPVDEIVGRSATLAAAFRRHALPVVLVNVAGGAPGRTDVNRPAFTPPPDFADLVEELDVQPGDHLVTKHRRSAFHDTSLHAHLRSLGVTQIVLAGVATTSGVESTARAAYDHGYHVVLATDAMTDTDADAHHNSIERIFPKLGETATTAEILDMLDKTR